MWHYSIKLEKPQQKKYICFANIIKKLLVQKNKEFFGSPSWTRTNDPAVNSRMLYRLSYRGIFMSALPIFPGRFQPSIFGANELNYCVRDGNRWTLIAINTDSRNTLSRERKRYSNRTYTKLQDFFSNFFTFYVLNKRLIENR